MVQNWGKNTSLIGNSFIFISNLEPRMMMGLESQGMILAAEGEDEAVPLTPLHEVAPGSKIR